MNRFLALLAATVIALGTAGCGGGGTSADPLGTDSLIFGYLSTSTSTDWVTAPQVNTSGTVALTARVTNASGKAVVNREVTFSVSGTGGGFLSGATAMTNASGDAVVIYTAGSASGVDVVRASISNGASMIANMIVGGGGTDGRQIALQGSATSLSAGQKSVLTATVTNGTGSPVIGATVVFSFISNASGAPAITILNGGRTDGVGRAMAIYTAGAAGDVQDIVQAQIVGLAAAPPLTLTITAATATATKTLALSAGSVSLAAGESSILTAKVTDGSGNPLSGQTVTFRFLGGGAAPSGATLSVLNGGTTDASGQALAVYTAGSVTPTLSLQDIVEAAVAGASGAVLIARTSSTAVAPVGNHMTLVADVTSLAAGQNSILTAKVTDGSGNPLSGQTVAFRFLGGGAAPSGATLTILNSGTTDANGQALAVYTAGSATPTSSIQDIVEAAVTGSSGAVVITRTSGNAVAPLGNRIALTTDLTSLVAGQSAVLTATVTDGSGNPVGGQTVTFAPVIVNSGATLVTINGTTDSNGRAVAIYTAGAASPTLTLYDTIQASVVGSAGALVMTRTAPGGGGGTGGGFSIIVVPTLESVAAGELNAIVATVRNADGTAASGQTVAFRFLGGTPAPSGATLSVLNGGITDPNGEVWVIYTAGATNPTQNVQDVVEATVTGAAGATIITRKSASTGNRFDFFVTIPDTSVARFSLIIPTPSNCMLKAKVTSSSLGATVPSPVVGETVTFSIFRGPGTLPALNTAVTDTNGEAWILFNQPVPAAGETIVRATIPVSTNSPNGGDAVVIVYW